VTADLHKLSAGRADYYVREVARDHEEYLSGNGESPRGVLGAGSTALGKQGVCTEEEFRRLFAWRHPDTGEQLGRAPRSDAMPAWTWCYAPSRTSPSCMPSATSPPAEPPCRPTRQAWRPR